jgi:hypothetical protein
VAYSTVAAESAPGLVAGVGVAGIAFLVAGASLGASDFVPAGIALVGAAYLLVVLFGGDAVDLRAPLVAGALVLAAELAYSSLEPPLAPASRAFRALRSARAALTVAGAVLVAALVLVASVADVGSPAVLEAIGIASAVAALGLLAWLARGLT